MIARPAVARTKAREVVGDAQPNFGGGLNTVSNDIALRQDQMRQSDNVRLTAYGSALKRAGTQRTAAALAAATVRGGIGWRATSSTFYSVALCNGSIFTTTYGAFPLTWTNRGGTFSASAVPSFAAFNDGTNNVLYVATGGTLKKMDNTGTITSCSNAVQATGVAVYHDRLWGWGVSGHLDSIYYSNLSGATASTGGDSLGYAAGLGGQIIVRTFGQQDIVAAAPVNTSLIIWHRRGMSRVTGFGNSDITVSPEAITADVGLVGQNALCVYDNIAYFVADRGVYQANEASVRALDTPDKPDPVAPVITQLDASSLALVKCAFNRAKHELWVYVPTYGVYIYHTYLQSWSGPFADGYISPESSAIFESVDASNQPIMLRGDTSGFISVCDTGTKDNVAADGTGGTAYSSVVRCHRMYCNDPTDAKGFRRIYVLLSTGGSMAVNVAWNTLYSGDSYQVPNLTSGGAWGTGTWGSGTWGVGGQTPFYVPCAGLGPFMDVTITDSGTGSSEIASVQVEGFSYGQR